PRRGRGNPMGSGKQSFTDLRELCRMSGSYEFSDPASAAARFLWSSQGGATRRQWWLGHLSAALLAWLGFMGGVGIIMSAAVQLGLDPGEAVFKSLTMAAAALCLLQFVVASNALCRRRLNERDEPHDLVDACIGFTILALALALNDAARALMATEWPLPAAPRWLIVAAMTACFGSLVALVLECGVLEHLSLTEIWRGRRRAAQLGGRVEYRP
ncbi:MAG: hypothetical protein ACHQAY_27110, partial [Hyphomicrobiales bacterium]